MSESLKPGDLVPSTDIWSREDFLAARAAQRKAPLVIPDWMKDAEIIEAGDPGDEIICDGCNCEILTETVILISFGRQVRCPDCYQQYYAKEPLEYRRILPDGTLGPRER